VIFSPKAEDCKILHFAATLKNTGKTYVKESYETKKKIKPIPSIKRRHAEGSAM
jgi:hypothetical protein